MATMVASRAKRALGIFVDILTGVFIAVLLACVIARLAFGVRAFAVLTSSMSPTLAVGDLVIDVPASYESINENDVITYVLNSDLDVVTHRVVGKNATDQTLITKGDANSSVDGSPVAYQNVVGVVRASVPKLGSTLRFLSTPAGKVVGVTVVLALMIALIIVRLLVGMYERDDDASGGDAREVLGSGEDQGDDAVAKSRPTMGAGRVGVTEGDSQRLGERRRTAIAAVIAAEFDDEWDDDDAEWEDDDAWDDESDELDEDDGWNGDFTGDDMIFGGNDEYDVGNDADGAQPSRR